MLVHVYVDVWQRESIRGMGEEASLISSPVEQAGEIYWYFFFLFPVKPGAF